MTVKSFLKYSAMRSVMTNIERRWPLF